MSGFIYDFHNIQGVTIGERRKNLNRLLRNKLTTDDVQSVLEKLKPKTYLENVFYIDTLIYLKEGARLLNILKQGHERFVNVILKQQWFLQEVFNVTAEELVSELLPAMSYIVKKKLLKKLCFILPENEMDQAFDLIVKRYGLFLATTVIPGCSSQKIEYILKNNDVHLHSSQLKMLYNKQASLIKLYVDQHQQESEIFDKIFLTYIASKDHAFFWELVEGNDFIYNVKLGRRTTIKAIKLKKPEIISDPNKYIKYLRHETLVTNLNKQGKFNQLYHNLFPRDIETLDVENLICNQLLKYHPKHDQYRLFVQTFTDIIKEDISHNISCLDDFLLGVIDNEVLRETLAQLKYKEYFDYEYIKYYRIENCLTLIKNALDVTSSINERSKLLCILVKSCAINKDLNALEKVLKYFCDRYRNDDKIIRTDFLNTIEDNFNSDELKQTHWKYLNEIFTIQTLNEEFCQHKLRMIYIKFLYENKRSTEEIQNAILGFIMDQVIANFQVFESLSTLKDAIIERDILLAAIQNFPKIVKSGKIVDYSQSIIFCEIFAYNLRYPEHRIHICKSSTLAQTLRRTLEANYLTGIFENQIQKEVCKLNRDDFDNEILNYYLEKTRVGKDLVLTWYLKYDPLVIVENFEKIMKSTPSIICGIWIKIKLYSHLDLDNMAIKYCLKQLNNKEANDRMNMIKPLSFLCTSEDYITIITEGNFLPTSPKLAIEDQNAKEIYKLQQTFARNFKNLNDPLKFVNVLLEKFCQGDYLQASRSSLYSAFYRCPENKLQVYIEKLYSNPALSVKKHSLFLAYVFDQQTVLKTLKYLEKGKEIASLQKHMFSSMLKYFSKNPNDEFFEIVISLMSLLKEHDTESLNLLLVTKISGNYKPSYLRSVMKLMETFKLNPKNSGNVKFTTSLILDLVDNECMQRLPDDFCREIIYNNFLTLSESHTPNSGILSFVVKYLIYRNEKKVNYNLVFSLLSNYKLQTWNNSNLKERKIVYSFFKTFYTMVCEQELYSEIANFFSCWKNIFTPIETFQEYILLSLLELKKDSKIGLELYSEKLVLFSEKIYAEFGQIIYPKFITILAKHIYTMEKNSIDLLSNMLKFKTSSQNCILIIELINFKGNLFYKDKIRTIYREIDTALSKVTDPDVQLYYNLYRRS